MRPIWLRLSDPPAGAAQELDQLWALERAARQPLACVLDLAHRLNVDVDSVRGIAEGAEADLCVGCEAASAGYFKQAYALWRLWFEQSIFALYFLEAPLHREAWRVVEEVDPGKEPLSKLMLHQLTATSGVKHPFAVVYEHRFASLHSAIKVASNMKSTEALRLVKDCETDMSQGVHGTFTPRPLASPAELPGALAHYALPMLQRARTAVGVLCFAYAYALIEPTEQQLAALGSAPPEGGEDENMALLRPLMPALERWLEHLRKLKGGKDGNRG